MLLQTRDIKAIMEGPPHQLLESVAETISSMLLDSYPKIQAVELRLTKPHVAVPGAFDSLGIIAWLLPWAQASKQGLGKIVNARPTTIHVALRN